MCFNNCKNNIDMKPTKIYKVLPEDAIYSEAYRSVVDKKHIFPKTTDDDDISEMNRMFNSKSSEEKKNYKKIHSITLPKNILVIDFDAHGDKEPLILTDIVNKFPFLSDCCYTRGIGLKGYHFFVRNEKYGDFTKGTNINPNSDFDIDFITGVIHELYNSESVIGDNIKELSDSEIEIIYPEIINKMKSYTQDEDDEKTTEINVTDELIKKTTSLIKIIKRKYSEDYGTWIKICASLWNTFGDKKLIHLFSSKSRKYNENEINVKDFGGMNLLTIGTLNFYAKLSNPLRYSEILINYSTSKINPLNLLQNYSVAEFFCDNCDEIIACSDSFYWYDPKLKIWIEKDKENTFNLTIRDFMDIIYDRCSIKIKEIGKELFKKFPQGCQSKNKHCNCEFCEAYNDFKLKETNNRTNKTNLTQLNFLKNVSDSLIDFLVRYKKAITLNANPDIFCFTDKTLCMKTKKFVERNKYDYITHTCGYSWENKVTSFRKLENILKLIFPDDSVKDCFMQILRQALRGEMTPYFTSINGCGRNGKGLILEMMRNLCGEYAYQCTPLLLTTPWKTGGSPEIANMNNKRLVVYSELPDENKNDKVKGDTVKKLRGQKILTGRQLYSKRTEQNNFGTHIMESNDRPDIAGDVQNESFRQTFLDIEFVSTFTSNKQDIKTIENYHPIDTDLFNIYAVSDECRNTLLMYLIQDKYDKIVVPESVLRRSESFLKNCNPMLKFVEENYKKITEPGKLDYTPLKTIFNEYKQCDDYNNSSKEERRKYCYQFLLGLFKKNECYRDTYQYKDENNKKVCKRSVLFGYVLTSDDSSDEELDECEIDDDNNSKNTVKFI